MAGFTNRGKYRIMAAVFRGAALPAHVYVALATAATAPTCDTNVLADLTEIADGNGYMTGGYQLHLDSTDFDTIAEDDGGNLASVKIKDVVWTGTAGPIPASGAGASYVVLLDDNATVADREVWVYWSLASAQSVVDGQAITLADLELRGLES